MANQRKSLTHGGSLKVVEHLEGETVQRRAHRGEEELLRIL
jgi:hypothetical protein